MNSKRASSTRAGGALAILAFMALVIAACTPPPEPAKRVDFDSPATGQIHIDIFSAGDPTADPPTEDSTIPVDLPISAQAAGTWRDSGSGPFSVNLTVDNGEFKLLVPGLPELTVAYSVGSVATGNGHFDPKTGVGSFDTTITVTVDSVDLLGPIAAPCDLGLDLSLAGRINPSNGRLSVIQDGFTLIPPAASDCGGLGSVFGGLLGNPMNQNTMTLGFDVGTF